MQRRYPDHVWINWPPRTTKALKSKSGIRMFLDASREDILEELDCAEVSENHVKLLTCMLRKQYFERYFTLTDDETKWLDTQIRGTLHQLLRAGDWIDEPENLGLKKLNNRLEKFDLGRRSDLKFSSVQSLGKQKYDPDFSEKRIKDLEETPDFDLQYQDGTPETRKSLREERPWMAKHWIESYGE